MYGNEYYFGGGIQHAPAGTTPYGTPIRVVDLGVTHVPQDVFEMYLQDIGPRYTAETYSLLTHNCNNFSNEVAQFLVGATIPDYILQLPNEVMNSPMGAVICELLSSFILCVLWLIHLFYTSILWKSRLYDCDGLRSLWFLMNYLDFFFLGGVGGV